VPEPAGITRCRSDLRPRARAYSEVVNRPPNGEERAILDFLLSIEFPGRDALSKQAGHARVVGRCHCGCATVNLAVDRDSVGPAQVVGRTPVDAMAREEGWGLILFVDDGYLSSLEIYSAAEEPPSMFPSPSVFNPPRPALA
jgi:hypothetical protein